MNVQNRIVNVVSSETRRQVCTFHVAFKSQRTDFLIFCCMSHGIDFFCDWEGAILHRPHSSCALLSNHWRWLVLISNYQSLR